MLAVHDTGIVCEHFSQRQLIPPRVRRAGLVLAIPPSLDA